MITFNTKFHFLTHLKLALLHRAGSSTPSHNTTASSAPAAGPDASGSMSIPLSPLLKCVCMCVYVYMNVCMYI